MTLLPSTWALDRLRRAVRDGDTLSLFDHLCEEYSEHVDHLVAGLRALRGRFAAVALAADSDAEAVARSAGVFFEAWAAFGGTPSSKALHLRPLYDDPAVVQLLRRQLARFVLLERAQAQLPGSPGLAGTGHLAIGGAFGVGKTYLLRGLALVVAALGHRVVPVTWSYEDGDVVAPYPTVGDSATATAGKRQLVSPSSLLTAAAECAAARAAAVYASEADYLTRVRELAESAAVAENTHAALAPALWGGAVPMLLLDEVTLLYRDDEADAHFFRGSLAVREILQVSRVPNTAVLLSGSSAQFHDQLFARGRWRKHSSLNATVFAFEEVHPFRSAEHLSAYMTATYLSLPAGLPDCAALLSYTGGVGRAIARVCADGATGVARPPPPVGSVDPVSAFHSDPLFALAAHTLLTPHRDALAGGTPYPPPLSTPLAAVAATLDQAGESMDAVTSRIDAWRDAGLLYLEQPLSGDGEASRRPPAVQLLYPCHARAAVGRDA